MSRDSSLFLITIFFGFIYLFSSFFSCSSSAQNRFNYPLAFTPEDLSSINGYISKKGVGIGGELAIYGADYSSFLKQYFGDFISVKAPDIHFGVTGNRHREVSMYLSPAFKIFFSPGFGKAVRAYIRYNGTYGFGLTTAIYAFYTLPFKLIVPYEYLTIYVGFKSNESNFNKDNTKEIFSTAYKLFGSEKPPIVGLYYSWSVFGAKAISLESDFKSAMVIFHFGGSVF